MLGKDWRFVKKLQVGVSVLDWGPAFLACLALSVHFSWDKIYWGRGPNNSDLAWKVVWPLIFYRSQSESLKDGAEQRPRLRLWELGRWEASHPAFEIYRPRRLPGTTRCWRRRRRRWRIPKQFLPSWFVRPRRLPWQRPRLLRSW